MPNTLEMLMSSAYLPQLTPGRMLHVALFIFFLVSCDIGNTLAGSIEHSTENKFRNEPIRPIPQSTNEDPLIAAFGKQLFSDNRLSRDNTLSCASCHPLNLAGVDGRRFSFGLDGQIGLINTPTVYNSSLNLGRSRGNS
jgi:cytochrome c peroxidase